MPSIEVFCSESLEKLKTYPDNHFDSIVTDAPYGLGQEPDALEVLRDWVEKGYHIVNSKGGFMSMEWDSFVPQPNFWKEVFRVLKPGGFLLCACGTRTHDWMVLSIRLGGFTIKDVISWIYGSGFPKSLDISKAIDKFFEVERKVVGKRKHPTLKDTSKNTESRSAVHTLADTWEREWDITEPTTEEAKKWDGYGTAVKPAQELWTLAQKPISEKTIAANVLKWGTGCINIDGCRIGYESGGTLASNPSLRSHINAGNGGNIFANEPERRIVIPDTKGRWPANVVFSHHPDCVCLGTKKVKAISGGTGEKSMGALGKNGKYGKYALNKLADNAGGLGDANGQEEVENWQCVDGCPIKELDGQSGVLTSGKVSPDGFKGEYSAQVYGKYANNIINPENVYGDTGGASRFFYVAKASKSERNKGLELLNFKKVIGHNRFDKCKTCGKYIFQNPDRDSACKCEESIREDNAIEGNYHPTVKPVSLMQNFVKLVTPKGGKVCDPFNGSGTTGIACKLEGFDYVGIEQEEDFVLMSKYRIAAWVPDYYVPEHSLVAGL